MSTFAYGVTQLETLGNVTLINDYLDLPERRGSNVTIPLRHGTVFAQKFYNERKISFGIAVLGTSLTDLESKMNTIRGLFGLQTQQTLTIVFGDTTTKTALVTIDEPMQVSRTGSLARIVVTMTMTEPFFRLSTPIADNTVTIDSSPHAMAVTNTGTVEERDPTIIITGPFSSMTITNSTNAAVLTYTGAIDAGETVTIGTLNGEFYATHNVDGNVIGNVTHSGSSALLPIEIGANTLAITSAGGDNSGTVKITFYPPFI